MFSPCFSFKEIGARLIRGRSRQNSAGCFEWVDGPLVTAMIEGNWVLLSHAEQAPDAPICLGIDINFSHSDIEM